jgi:hypothetical protein
LRDFIEIGPAPFEEDCAQAGEEDTQRKPDLNAGHSSRLLERSWGLNRRGLT